MTQQSQPNLTAWQAQQESPISSETPERPADHGVSISETVSESIRKITQSPAILPGQGIDAVISAAHTWCSILAQSIMRTSVVWADPEETIEQAFAKMQQHDIGYILVGRNGSLAGIVSKSDIRGAMSPYLQEMFARWRRPLDVATLQIRLKWVMSKPVYTVCPDTPIASFVQQMLSRKIRALPVADEKGSVVGIITVFEVFNAILNMH
jgi:CBS domain-containing protein